MDKVSIPSASAERCIYIERLGLYIMDYVHHAIFIQSPSQNTRFRVGGYMLFQHHINSPSPPLLPKLHLKTRYSPHFYSFAIEPHILQYKYKHINKQLVNNRWFFVRAP